MPILNVISEIKTKTEAIISYGDIRDLSLSEFDPINELNSFRDQQIAASTQLLSNVLNKKVLINRSEKGKPQLTNAKGFISISHCQNKIATIYHPLTPVAIDIEDKNRNVDRITSKFTSTEELETAAIHFSSNPAIFIWSCKECLFKILGLSGVHFKEQLRLEDIELSIALSSHWKIEHPSFQGRFQISTLFFGNTLCSFIDSQPLL